MALTRLQRAAVEQSTGGTHYPVDRTRNLIAIKGTGWDSEAIRIVLDKRAQWLDWLTVTQRRWQRDTRNFRLAIHHDSISTREKYVRCTDDVPAFYQRPYRLGGPSNSDNRHCKRRKITL